MTLPKRSIYVLIRAVALFSKVKARSVNEDFSDFLLLNVVLPGKFVNNLFKPYKTYDIQLFAPL